MSINTSLPVGVPRFGCTRRLFATSPSTLVDSLLLLSPPTFLTLASSFRAPPTSRPASSRTMGFFNRRTAPADPNTATATGTHEKKPGLFARRGHHNVSNGVASWNTRPTFGQWIKATALDIITMACMGAIGLGVYMANPAPSRSFPGKF